MARPGRVPVLVLAVACALAWTWLTGPARWGVGASLALLLLLVMSFYRDPERRAPDRAGTFVVAPADGRVVDVQASAGGLRLSIFLSAFDVHVNRAPAAGRVVDLARTPGRFAPAFLRRASTENERVTLALETPEGERIRCTQVAGLLARRILNWVRPGQALARGERYGMIALGSRLDLHLPAGYVPLVERGRRVRAGQTPVAERPGG